MRSLRSCCAAATSLRLEPDEARMVSCRTTFWSLVSPICSHTSLAAVVMGIRWLIATPEFHHWHHSSEDQAVDKNYAAFLPIYDKLFGTLIMPNRLAAEYGTRASTKVPEGVVDQFLVPFRRDHRQE